jgi:hypothetical protein
MVCCSIALKSRSCSFSSCKTAISFLAAASSSSIARIAELSARCIVSCVQHTPYSMMWYTAYNMYAAYNIQHTMQPTARVVTITTQSAGIDRIHLQGYSHYRILLTAPHNPDSGCTGASAGSLHGRRTLCVNSVTWLSSNSAGLRACTAKRSSASDCVSYIHCTLSLEASVECATSADDGVETYLHPRNAA